MEEARPEYEISEEFNSNHAARGKANVRMQQSLRPSRVESADLSFVADLPFDISVEFGATRMSVNDFLNIRAGSVIELQKLAGEPLTLKMNGKPIAVGEAVIMNDHFALRVTDLYSEQHSD